MSPSFELWLETEEGDPTQPANSQTENFCNIHVTLADGRRYALNVWTFDFLPLARYPWPYKVTSQELAKYVHPPDLFVERLDRSTIEAVVAELLENQEMKSDWLCPPDEGEDDIDRRR
jgi:hypothetical protein